MNQNVSFLGDLLHHKMQIHPNRLIQEGVLFCSMGSECILNLPPEKKAPLSYAL
jgi:hypothetical protein